MLEPGCEAEGDPHEMVAESTSFKSARHDTEVIMLQHSMVAVPEGLESRREVDCPDASLDFSLCPPHLVELEVLQTLRDYPGVSVESLTAHRTDDGVCLHGVVVVDDPSTDVEDILHRALSIDHVINRMLVKYGHCETGSNTEYDQSFMWG